jgi:hypothetical protein
MPQLSPPGMIGGKSRVPIFLGGRSGKHLLDVSPSGHDPQADIRRVEIALLWSVAVFGKCYLPQKAEEGVAMKLPLRQAKSRKGG